MLAIRRAHPRLSGAAGEPEPFILMLPGWLIGFVPENDGMATAGQLAVYYNPGAHPPVGQPARRYLAQAQRRRPRRGNTLWPRFRDALELAPRA